MLPLDASGGCSLRSIHWEGTTDAQPNQVYCGTRRPHHRRRCRARRSRRTGARRAIHDATHLRRAAAHRAGQYQSQQPGGWGVGQVVAGGTGHLVPTAFSGSLVDNAVNQTLFTFDQVKGGGNANHNQPTITCTQSETGVLGDFLNPGDTLPPGTSPTDSVTFTLTVIAVRHS